MPSMARNCLVINLDRCIGCYACEVACKMENDIALGERWNKVVQVEPFGEFPHVSTYWLPVMCQQCEESPCTHVCPTGASYRDEAGVVRVDHGKCIGCKYCIAACPYEVRSFLSERIEGYFPGSGLTEQERVMYGGFEVGKVYKCDFCRSKGYTDGIGPSCVRACPGDARVFGDLDDPESEVARLLAAEQVRVLGEEYGTKPNVYYVARSGA